MDRWIDREQPYPRGVTRGTQPTMKWNGWGYEGTSFAVNAAGQVYLTGSQYELSGKVSRCSRSLDRARSRELEHRSID